jgi:hypothetical protein
LPGVRGAPSVLAQAMVLLAELLLVQRQRADELRRGHRRADDAGKPPPMLTPQATTAAQSSGLQVMAAWGQPPTCMPMSGFVRHWFEPVLARSC